MKNFIAIALITLSSASFATTCEDTVFDYVGSANGPVLKKINELQDKIQEVEENREETRKLQARIAEIMGAIEQITVAVCK